MNVLFLHQNFPGQFLHVAQALKSGAGVRALAVTDAANARPELLRTVRYTFDPRSAGKPHRLGASYNMRAARGEAAARAMLDLREQGFVPDLVIGHSGWGETLFVRDVFPQAKLLVHAEYFYSAAGADTGFDPEFAQTDPLQALQIRSRNAALLCALFDADFGVAPTRWQGTRFPAELQKKIAILHEGIDTDHARPDPGACFMREDPPTRFTRGDEVITFINRNLEPYRGYHVFMRALPAILRERPKAHVVIVGGDGVSYGAAPPAGGSWKQVFLAEVSGALPLERVHFVGKIPHPDLINLLQISSAHVYLTYPFVLSWSMLEAMSAGAPVIASSTAPVQEMIEHGANGMLVDFFDTKALSHAVVDVLANPARYAAICEAARRTIVQSYDLRRVCLPKWMSFIDTVTGLKTA
jgi:glycosyltransferase involved in cell wall biosynthesis